MFLISNQQRREVVDFLTAFVELAEDNGSNRIHNMKRRAGLLIKKLNKKEEISIELIKALKNGIKD